MLNTSEAQFAVALAERVRSLRLQQALSQQELADRAGLSRNVIINLERGTRLAHPRSVRKVARALGVHPTAITLGA